MLFRSCTGYEDKPSGRQACLDELDKKILEASALSAKPFGDKNLLYYALYLDEGYVKLFDMSVCSILSHTNALFDVLVITDENTKRLIQTTQAAQLIDIKYLITETPTDGVEASKKKISIFEWDKIKDYAKVLFLDCDTAAIAGIDEIFSENLRGEYLYSVNNKIGRAHV